MKQTTTDKEAIHGNEEKCLSEDKANDTRKRHIGLDDDQTIICQENAFGHDVDIHLCNLPEHLDISSIRKHVADIRSETISFCVNNNKETHENEEPIEMSFRKRSKICDNPDKDIASTENAPCSSSPIIQRMIETTSGHSSEAISFCHLENKMGKEMTVECGSFSNAKDDVVFDYSVECCSNLGDSVGKNLNSLQMGKSLENSSANFLFENVTKGSPQISNYNQIKCDSSSSRVNEVNNACSAGENVLESLRVLETKTVCILGCASSNEALELERKSDLEDSKYPSSPLCATNGGMTNVRIQSDIPSRILQSSLEKNPVPSSKKKLLVLDVNGLLADIVSQVSHWYKPDLFISGKGVFKRPFCKEFLQFCFERFDVGVWSSRSKRNVHLVLDFIMGKDKDRLLFCWDQSHCTDTGFNTVENREKPLMLKELRKLWEKHDLSLPWERGEYNESNTLLLDDSPHKALRNPQNTAVFPYPYRYKNEKDYSLGPGGDLRVYLEGLASAEDVQKYVERNPFGQRPITKKNLSWGFYLKVIGTTSSHPEQPSGITPSQGGHEIGTSLPYHEYHSSTPCQREHHIGSTYPRDHHIGTTSYSMEHRFSTSTYPRDPRFGLTSYPRESHNDRTSFPREFRNDRNSYPRKHFIGTPQWEHHTQWDPHTRSSYWQEHRRGTTSFHWEHYIRRDHPIRTTSYHREHHSGTTSYQWEHRNGRTSYQ